MVERRKVQGLDEVAEWSQAYTVGFVQPRIDPMGSHSARLCGSGTLVQAGSVAGILTAAHVLDKLPNSGLMTFKRFVTGLPSKAQFMFQMDHVKKLPFGERPFGEEGPDLGFLFLPPSIAEDLKAYGSLFLNLNKQKELARAPAQYPRCVYCVSGVIDQLTSDEEPTPPVLVSKVFGMAFRNGDFVDYSIKERHDILQLALDLKDPPNSPTDYGGLSGGAVWRSYVEEAENGEHWAVDKQLYGVPYHQSDIEDGKRIISCHGPKSVFDFLLDEIDEQLAAH